MNSRSIACSLLVGATWAVSPDVFAVDCSALPGPIYGIGGSAQRPLLARVGARLSGLSQNPITVIYQAPGACLGINAVLNNTRITGEGVYWTSNGTETRCTLPLTGQAVDFAAMGNGAELCPGITSLPTDVGDFQGPITTWNVIVPLASSQRSISSEAFYFVYGFGNQSRVAPWTDEAQLFKRDSNSAAQIFFSLASGLPLERFRGIDVGTNMASVTRAAAATNPEAAISFVSGETADGSRNLVRTLAWQQSGQSCGYTPDSSATRFDKLNVRNGLYWMWSVTHFFTRVNTQNVPTSANTARFIGYFTGTTTSPEVPILDIEIQNGNIPLCAMQVSRQRDLGPLASYAPPAPCGCYFERVATGTSTCTPCTTNTDCGGAPRACRNGFCEAY